MSTEWADYVEKPKKYQALRPHFFSMGGGGWRILGVGGWVSGDPQTVMMSKYFILGTPTMGVLGMMGGCLGVMDGCLGVVGGTTHD